MDFEAGLIAAIVRQGYDDFVDVVFDQKWVSRDCNRILFSLSDHWHKFSATMGFDALQQICDSSFENQPSEPIGFWVDHLRKKHLSNSLNESLSEAAKTVRTNPELSYETLIQNLTEMSSSHTSDSQLIPVFSKELLEDDLEKANTKKGITTLSTVFDDRVRGWGEQDLIVMAARPGVGKCHGKGTKILMHDGSVKCVEDIVVGDQLMGPDSTPRNVLSIARGVDEMFMITPCVGNPWTCNRGHILSLKLFPGGKVHNIPLHLYLALKNNKLQSNLMLYKKDNVLIDHFTVDSLGLGDYYGFEIDGDHLYCLEDTTVTHNTFALLHNCLRAWEEKKKVILAITEMSARSIRLRAAAMACKVDYGRIRSGSLISIERQKINACMDLWEEQELLGNFVLYGDSFNVTLEALEAKVHSFRPDFVAIDGVYLLKSLKVKEKDKYRRIAELFDELKSFAKRINRPVMVTTQLNRPPNGKTDAVGLERLAFSDNVGMVSDYIIFLEQTEAMKRAWLMEIQFGKMREADNYDPMYLNWDFSSWDFADIPKAEALSRITEAEEELKKEKNSAGEGAIKAAPDFTPRKKKEFVDYRARQIND